MRSLALTLALATAAGGAAAQTPDQALDAFFEAEWEYTMQDSPVYASMLGDLRFNDRIDDLSLAHYRENQQHERDALARLRAIDPAGLDARHRESYEIYLDQLQTAVDGQRCPEELMPVNQHHGYPTDLPSVVDQLPFRSAKHYEDYLKRLAALPQAFTQVRERLEEGVRRGITPTREPLKQVEPQLRAIAASAPADSPFYAPFGEIPDTIA